MRDNSYVSTCSRATCRHLKNSVLYCANTTAHRFATSSFPQHISKKHMNPQQLLRWEQLPRLGQSAKRTVIKNKYAALAILLVAVYFLSTQLSVLDRGEYTLHVASGMTGRSIAAKLRTDDIVRSTLAMRAALALSGKSHAIKACDYLIDTTSVRSVFSLAQTLVSSTPTHEPLLVTIPEGTRGRDILAALEGVMTPEALEGVTAETFDVHIGYLFPDTYAIDETVSVEDFIVHMRAQYEANLEPLRETIKASSFTEAEVIILASILEREANDEESMRRVAGILQNRLKQGMRLQVDATLAYLLDKTSAELTQSDLALASPFNTYRNEGLPPAPIANPGLEAINAVLNPIPSKHLFYLTGSDGTFHYATTFEEHTANKAKYLR